MGSVFRLLLLSTHSFNNSVCILLSHIVGGDDDTEWCALIKFYSVLDSGYRGFIELSAHVGCLVGRMMMLDRVVI